MNLLRPAEVLKVSSSIALEMREKTGAAPVYAPIPATALGPALNDKGYYTGRVERNLYWVTDGV